MTYLVFQIGVPNILLQENEMNLERIYNIDKDHAIKSKFNDNMSFIEYEIEDINNRLEKFEDNLPEIIAKATVEALREYLKIDKED